MRIVFGAWMIALLPLLGGCRSSPPTPAASSGVPGTTLVDEAKRLGEQHQVAMDAIKKQGGHTQVDADDPTKAVVRADLHGMSKASTALVSLAPLTKLHNLNVYNTDFSDADLERVRGLQDLDSLNLSATKVTDAGLAILRSLPNLHALYLNETKISDAGLQNLRGLTSLEELSLYHTRVTDEGLAQLKSLTNLQKLTLSGSSITDRGLAYLRGMPHLRELTLLSTKATDSAVRDLKNSCGQLRIIR